jgi:hypothetical protein
MESTIVELRDRSRRQVRRASRAALIALGVGAAVGVVVVGVIVVNRLTRPPSTRERLRRLLPPGVLGLGSDLRQARRTLELGLRRQVPNMRLYVGDRQVGEEPPATPWERIAVRAAQAAGTAAAGALASRLLAGLTTERRSKRQDAGS